MNDLNTVEIPEHVCGSYHDHQGMCNIHSHMHITPCMNEN